MRGEHFPRLGAGQREPGSALTQGERTLIAPLDPGLAERLSAGERVILEIGQDAQGLGRLLVHFLRRKNVDVRRILIRCRDMESFLRMETKNFTHEIDIALQAAPEISEIMTVVPTLRDKRFRFTLPLRGPRDALLIKLLTSLGVNLILDLRDPCFAWREIGELIADTLLNRAPRGSLEPLTTLYHSLQGNGFFLGAVYHEDPRLYTWMDEKGNLALSEKDRRECRWIGALGGDRGDINLMNQSIYHPFSLLRRKHRCAFCEGFFLCRGYLDAYGQQPACRGFFSAFLDAAQIRRAREEKIDG